jgi:hypothetical protein
LGTLIEPNLSLAVGSANAKRRALRRRVEKVVGYQPLVDMGDDQRRELHEALLDADSFGDLPKKRQAASSRGEQNRPKLHVVTGD